MVYYHIYESAIHFANISYICFHEKMLIKECWALLINICPWSFPITTRPDVLYKQAKVTLDSLHFLSISFMKTNIWDICKINGTLIIIYWIMCLTEWNIFLQYRCHFRYIQASSYPWLLWVNSGTSHSQPWTRNVSLMLAKA